MQNVYEWRKLRDWQKWTAFTDHNHKYHDRLDYDLLMSANQNHTHDSSILYLTISQLDKVQTET